MKMIKVAHITKNLTMNGISNVVLNYSENLNPDIFQISIITGKPVNEDILKRCMDNGIIVITLPGKRNKPISYFVQLIKSLKKEKYNIIHIHGNSATITLELLIAKLCGIKERIAHCHSNSCDFVFVHKLLSPFLRKLYTKGYACSDEAGRWMFGEKEFTILSNGFQTQQFIFDNNTRIRIRNENNINEKYVIGTIARFNESKNHIFLLQVFEEIAKQNDEAVLLLAGDGPLLEKILSLIEKHPFKDRIFYVGVTACPKELYDSMDVFVLPSKYEGLGIVFIEAQINGLKCVTSDMVPRDVNICGNTVFLPLSEDISKWKEKILCRDERDRMVVSLENYKNAQKYDIKNCIVELENYYLKATYGRASHKEGRS